MDAWGSYQQNGGTRYANLQTWPNQKPAAVTFDPAAWQLKVIRLPSGGQIHVQYEQDDYSYVQDKTANALAELIIPPGTNLAENAFLINPSTAGVNSTAEIAKCCELINKLYVNQQQKIFFKFLYKLVGDGAPDSPTSCNSDYISGYVTVKSAVVDGTNIRIEVGGEPSDYTLPRQVCWDFTQSQRLGKLQNTASGANCSPAVIGFDPQENSATRLFRQFVAWAPRALLYGKSDLCKALKPELSYFKIPLPTSKKGGGLRVKRLLTYDVGLDNVPVLYGSEYEYKAYDELTKTWRSSGVATTEPGNMRVENALVSFVPRLSQTSFEKIVAGPDRKQSEGPIGESIMPAAAVGYSRVTIKNIHSGKTNPGYSITEYFTCKDAPVKWRMTPINSRTEYRVLSAGLVGLFDNNVWNTQGFSFILNNMHGQLKREATYAGSYDDINTQARSTLISEQKYDYFDPDKGDRIRLQNEPEDAGVLQSERVFPGKEVEVTTAQRAVRDNTSSVSVEGDIQFTPLFVAIMGWVTASASVSRYNSEFYSHTTSKVIRYPAIIKQVSSFHDGVRDTVENLAFDRLTGSPVATRSSDANRGAYLKQDVMASWVYPQLQGKALNEGVVLNIPKPGTGVRPNFAELTSGPVSGALYLKAKAVADCSLLASVRKGDVLSLEQLDANDNVLPVSYNTLYFAENPDLANKKIRLYPYPANSSLPTGTSYQQVRIVSSGNSNELKSKVGSTTYHRTMRKLLTLDVYDPYKNATPSDALSQQLQNAIQGLPANFTTKDITLSGAFEHINITGFKDRLPAACNGINTIDATISNLQFTIYKDAQNATVKVQLVAFDIDCGGIKTIR